jgi:hypothetical protein
MRGCKIRRSRRPQYLSNDIQLQYDFLPMGYGFKSFTRYCVINRRHCPFVSPHFTAATGCNAPVDVSVYLATDGAAGNLYQQIYSTSRCSFRWPWTPRFRVSDKSLVSFARISLFGADLQRERECVCVCARALMGGSCIGTSRDTL